MTEQEMIDFYKPGNPGYGLVSKESALTTSEWIKFISMVDSFALAKISGDYMKSDAIRIDIEKSQGKYSDDAYLKMHKTREFNYSLWFEPRIFFLARLASRVS